MTRRPTGWSISPCGRRGTCKTYTLNTRIDPMSASEDLKRLVNQLPSPDGRGMYLHGHRQGEDRDRRSPPSTGRQGERLGPDRYVGSARRARRRETPLCPALPGQPPPANQGRGRRAASSPRRCAVAARRQPAQDDPGLPLPGIAVLRARAKRWPPWASCCATRNSAPRPRWPW